MPASKYYNFLSGNVQVPGPDDPYNATQVGRDTFIDFGMDAQNAIGNLPAPVTQSEIGADAYLRAIGKIPDMPRDLMRMNMEQRQTIGAVPPTGLPGLPQFGKTDKPAQAADVNRGGSGSAGRGSQFGKSQFDLGLEPLEMPYSDVSDKPYELPDSVNVDVQSGTSLKPKPEQNVVDKEPDLQTPQGLYQALAKKYPDILTQNLDQLQKSRITDEDLENLSDRAGLGSLFIAASKAASGAGSIGGKTAESIAPAIVNREDTLARQRLKDRMDVASENMQMNAKAVDLAMKQINFADEREQYDPNSEVSKFARQFMQDEFNLKVPDNVPAYQLKQFLPAVVQKYQAQETGAYRNAMLEAQSTGKSNQIQYLKDKLAAEITKADKDRQTKENIARMKAGQAGQGKMLGLVSKDQANAEMKMKSDFRQEKVVQTYELANSAFNVIKENYKTPQKSTYTDQNMMQQYARLLDPTSVVRQEEFETVKKLGGVFASWKNAADVWAGKAQLQPSQRDELMRAAENVMKGHAIQYDKKVRDYQAQASRYELDPNLFELSPYSAGTPSGGRSLEQIRAEKEAIRKQLEAIQKGKSK